MSKTVITQQPCGENGPTVKVTLEVTCPEPASNQPEVKVTTMADTVQQIEVINAGGGTFTLHYPGGNMVDGEPLPSGTSDPIPHNADWVTVSEKLSAAFPTFPFGEGPYVVDEESGPLGAAPMVVIFRNELTNQNVPKLIADDSNLTPED